MLPLITSVLLLAHTAGAIIGAVGVTVAELLYIKATIDGRVDIRERHYIESTFFALRWGMSVLLITGFALIMCGFMFPEYNSPVLEASFWVTQTLILLVLIVGWMLARSIIVWWVGSALVFTAWWMILFLTVWELLPPSYFSLIFTYILLSFVVAGVLSYIRMIFGKRKHTAHHS